MTTEDQCEATIDLRALADRAAQARTDFWSHDRLDALAACEAAFRDLAARSPEPIDLGNQRTVFIVWNEDRSEGAIFDNEADAEQCRCGKFGGLHHSALGERFAEMYDDDERTVQRLVIDGESSAATAGRMIVVDG